VKIDIVARNMPLWNVEKVDFSCLQGRGWIRVVVFLDHLGELP